jgi:hypothetical protein
VRKQPCCTQMEVNHQAHSFTVDDQGLQIIEMHVEPKKFPALIEVQYVNVVTFTKNMATGSEVGEILIHYSLLD